MQVNPTSLSEKYCSSRIGALVLWAALLTRVPLAQAQTLAPGDVASWMQQVETLGHEAGRRQLSNDQRFDLAASMCHQAQEFDSQLSIDCEDDAHGGAIAVYKIGVEERLITISLDGGAILGNTEIVPYYVRLGVTPMIRRLPVPAFRDGRRINDLSVSGTGSVHGRVLTVINRCCAGMEGTTSTWRVTSHGTLALERVLRWRTEDGRERSAVLFPFR